MAVYSLKGWGRVSGEQVVVAADLDTADNPTMIASVDAAGGAAVTVAGVTIKNIRVRYLDGTLKDSLASLAGQSAVFAPIQLGETSRLVTINSTTIIDGSILIYGWDDIGDPGVEDGGAVPPAPASPGILARYWNNQSFVGEPILEQVEGSPNLPRTGGSPAPGVDANFSVRWTGSINFPATGAYRFRLAGDDQGDLYVNNKLLCQTDNSVKDSVTQNYDMGTPYPIWGSLVDNGSNAVYILYWQTPGSTVFVQVPDSAFTQATVTAPIQVPEPDQGRHYVEEISRYSDAV